jgi:hypothetical protein
MRNLFDALDFTGQKLGIEAEGRWDHFELTF